nr:hypothetical protein [Tanacetum cinerariifolium]
WQQVAAQTGFRIVRGNKVVIENRVTDYVQGFLNDDLERHLFSTQREVQLRAAAGSQRGQELDLYVQAVPLDAQGRPRVGERLLVFMEAKHHDNPEVDTALQAQLVNRYLRQHEARTGKPGAANELAALRQQLSQQAAQASANGLLLKSYGAAVSREGENPCRRQLIKAVAPASDAGEEQSVDRQDAAGWPLHYGCLRHFSAGQGGAARW